MVHAAGMARVAAQEKADPPFFLIFLIFLTLDAGAAL